MTLVRRIPGTGAVGTLGKITFSPRVQAGLVGCFLPRREAARTVRNLAAGGASAQIIGAPSYSTYAATLGPNGYLQTDIAETASFTFVSVSRKVTQPTVLISSQYGSSSDPFAALQFRTGSERRLAVRTRVTDDAPETALGYNVETGGNGFEFCVGACDAVALTQTVAMPRVGSGIVGGNPRVVSFVGTRQVSANKLRIGWANTNYGGQTEHALDMSYNRSLSLSEIQSLYEDAQAWFAPRGIAL